MSAALSTLILVIVGHFTWEGALIDLGPESSGVIAIALLLGAGLGMRSMTRLPYLAELVGLALLLPLRGPLSDALFAMLPTGAIAVGVVALVTLAPLGFILGKQVSLVSRSSLMPALIGFCFGEFLVQLGAVGFMPGLFTGLIAAGLLAALSETAQPAGLSAAEPSTRAGWQAYWLGISLGLTVVVLRRVIGAYEEPVGGGTTSVWIALLAPAVFVAWPVTVLASSPWARRLFGALAGVGLALALLDAGDALGMYEVPGRHVVMSRTLHSHALGSPAVAEWWFWLLALGGYIAAALGGALGTLGVRSLSSLVLGVAGALALAEGVMDVDPRELRGEPLPITYLGPMTLLLLASGAALVSSVCAWAGRWGPLGVVLLVVPFVVVPPERQYPFETIRRIGEPGIDGMTRRTRADAVVFSTFGSDVSSPEGVGRYYNTFTDREPYVLPEVFLDPEFALEPTDAHAGHDHGDESAEEVLTAEEQRAMRHFGLRISGHTLHADHMPVGPEGSATRLTRLFAPAGRSFVFGLGGELLAADLASAGLADAVDVASDVPLGFLQRAVLFEELGLDSGFPGNVTDDPGARLRDAPAGAFASVVVSPGPGQWPGSAPLLACESLERMRRMLADNGRCLVWVDTSSLSAGVLRSRLAAFGSVFGERSAAFVEMRELDAPFLLLLGWKHEAGRPDADSLAARMPSPWAQGFRTRMNDLDDLAALLVRDGPGLVRAADEWPRHRRSRPVPFVADRGGWTAVAEVFDEEARLGRVITGTRALAPWPDGLMRGLVQHGAYSMDLWRLRSQVVEVVEDVDWDAFDQEWIEYATAAGEDRGHPVLMQALAALLRPLIEEGNFTRFAMVYEQAGAGEMAHWRLAMLEAVARRQMLEPELALEAARRAERLRTP